MVPLPEGTLTFLLTDVESSSPLWDRYPAEMPEAIARLDQILTGVISGRRGHLIRSKGEGDSAFAVFPSAGDAVAAAVEVLQALLAEPWPIPEGLRVRVGVLTGEAHLRDGDYFGSDINRCARLRGLAHGGQILVSESAAVLVRDTLAEGATLQDLGQHKLRGLTRPERIYQLTVPGLSAQFPPLASAEAENHNLPEQLTSFVGREREMETILELLGKSRCVTVVGAGGAGKTRLALQTAAQCLDHFPDGVWLVPLASLVQGEAIGQSAALAARLRVDPGRTADEVLVAYFRRRTALLVLDNCEHLAEECARWTEQLLQACPWVRVLVTSREALRIPGEIAWEIPTLEVPSAQDLPKLRGELVGALEQYEALRLFVARAQWARPGFELTRANAPSVVQICHRLDGLPLAIELAAARVRHLRPDQIEARLKDRFRLLTGGARTALAHHQTLRALFDWSYDYLDPQEQRLLRRLSLFSTPWSLDAAESAASGDGLEPEDVLDLMGRLVDRSLLIAEPGEGVEHQYRMLQTVREYARERLRESGEWDTAWQRYADYHLERSRTAEAALRGPTQAAWLDRLDRELDNFRSVLEWGLTQPGSVSVGIQTCINLFRFWYVRGYFSEGRVWLERLLSTGQPLDPARRSRALNEVGNLLAAQGDLESSQAALEEALLLSREAQDTRGVARTGCNLGMLAALRGDYPRARRAFEQSLVSFRQLGDRTREAQLLYNLGLQALEAAEYEDAAGYLDDARALAAELTDEWTTAIVCQASARLNIELGDFPRAVSLLGQCVKSWAQLQDGQGLVSVLILLARVALHYGDPAQSARFLGHGDCRRSAGGTGLSPSERLFEQQIRMALDEQLGSEAVRPLLAEGQRWSPAVGATAALRWLESVHA